MRLETFACPRHVLVSAALVGLLAQSTTFASPPANDNFASAAPITTFPFPDTGDLNGTSVEPGEPGGCFGGLQQSVWYVLAPSKRTVVTVNLDGSDQGVVLNTYQSFGPGFGDLGFTGCFGFQGRTQFTAEAGNTYYLQVGGIGFPTANMVLDVQEVPPPVNDNFADAIVVDSWPFTGSADLTPATIEPFEPTSPPGAFTPIAASAWYRYTPELTQSLMVSPNGTGATPIIAVYTGTALSNLTPVAGISGFFGGAVFEAVAGTTYHIQLGRGPTFGGAAQISFSLGEAPLPVAGFGYNPTDPSAFDAVQFFDSSFDPAFQGFASWTWDFGDGATGSGQQVTHAFGADGNYTVQHTVTTNDGRSASTTGVVAVRTHDVAIVKLTVPNSARSGQVKELTASVRSSLYPESVQFTLSKSVPGFGLQTVGTLTQLIPVRSGNKTVPVTFSYTFSNEDAAVGKVTFQVTAQIVNGRDALPADNTAIAPPTRVTR